MSMGDLHSVSCVYEAHHITVTRTSTYDHRIFSYCAAKQLISLPFYICHLPTIESFNGKIKTHLFHEYDSLHKCCMVLLLRLINTIVNSCDYCQLTCPPSCLPLQIYDTLHPYRLFPDFSLCLLYLSFVYTLSPFILPMLSLSPTYFKY